MLKTTNAAPSALSAKDFSLRVLRGIKIQTISIAINGLVIASMFLVSGCEKYPENQAEVKGVVRDANTGNGIPNAKVALVSQDNGYSIGGGFKVVEVYTADANGAYSFSFTGNQSLNYYVSASTTMFREYIPNSSTLIVLGKKSTISVNLSPKAWLKLHIKNARPVDMNDLIFIGINGAGKYRGQDVDMLLEDEIDGGKNFTIYGFSEKGGMKKTHDTTIFCKAGDTTKYQLNY